MPRPQTLEVILAGEVPYDEGLAFQLELRERRIRGEVSDTVIVLQHPPVITLGHRGDSSNVIASPSRLDELGIAVRRTSRGGDVTYHGPGQVVMYPIVDLREARLGQAAFVAILEEAMIRATAEFGVEARRVDKKRGVFVGDDKIGAVGVHVAHSVTAHGLALNVDPDLSHFSLIVPCGLQDHGVSSLREVAGRPISREAVEVELVRHFAELLDRPLTTTTIGLGKL